MWVFGALCAALLIACGSIGMCILFFIYVVRRDESDTAQCHSNEEKKTEQMPVMSVSSNYATTSSWQVSAPCSNQMREIPLEFGTEHAIAPNEKTREDEDHAVMAAFMAVHVLAAASCV